MAGNVKGYKEGEKKYVRMNDPHGIVLCPLDDCLYFCDAGNNVIRKITKSGINY